MKKRTVLKAAAWALIMLVSTWGAPSVSTGEDFLEKLKKAAEQAAQQRQRQQQQQQTGQPRQSQAPQQQPQAQQSSQNKQQPREQPGRSVSSYPNEKPLPSPDFGTPEGTAKIAAKAGFLDVVGIKLGIPVKEAVEALKAHDANFKVQPITLREYEALPGLVMTPILLAPNPGGPSAVSGDDFTLFITYAPNEAFLWGLSRNLGFGREDSRPTVDNTLAGLRKKYGPESAKQVGANRLIWIYDVQGQQVMGAKAMDIYNLCSQTWSVKLGGDAAGGNRPDHNSQFSNSYFDQQLKGTYYYGTGGYGSPGGVCHAHSVLDVYYTHATPAGSTADLMSSMTMGAFNRQLEGSGITAAHTHLMAAVDKLNEKRGEEEGKRGGMKF
ncbi:MAG: hypothetical protein Q8L74_01750 [Nitrospirota bacterium]|nr:hypothetical protein [Nitrospirota bacterium]MDP2383583.1 hypothetical protein [Nitrospirota bacterium]